MQMPNKLLALGVGMALIALVYACQNQKTAKLTEQAQEEGIPMTIAIPLTPEQAVALQGISEMSRIDEISRTDDISRTDEGVKGVSRVDEGIRGVGLDIEVDGQSVASGVRGQIKSGVRGGIRGAEQSGVRSAEAGSIRGSPRRQDDDSLLVFEATFSFPIHMARDGNRNLTSRMKSTQNPNVEFLTVTTQVEVKATSEGGLEPQIAFSENVINMNQVELKDSGDGVSVLTKVLVAGVDAVAADPTIKVEEASVKAVYEQYAQKLEQTMQAQGYTVTVDVSQVDLTPPDTFISRDTSVVRSVVFKFTCNESYCTYRCSLDGAPFAACSSPYTPAPAPGERTLKVAASDKLGNTDTSPAAITFFSDVTPPEAISISVENGAEFVNKTLVDVAVKAKDDSKSMEMLLGQDLGTFERTDVKWIPYAEATKFSMPSGDGPKKVYVQFRDKAGNRSKILSDDIVLDTKAPDTSATCPPTLTNSKSASITFTSPETALEFMCQLDTGTPVPCVSPVAAANLADGAHAFEVKAKDKAGNLDATPAACKWTVDTVAPDTTISAAPASATNSTSASFTFSSADTSATFQCELDAAGFAACTSPKSYSLLKEGSHTFKARAVDAAGNVDASPASHTWTIDTTAPTVSISSQPTNPSTPNVSFAFSANETGSTFTCSLDSAAFASCTSPKAYSSLADGSHTFQVKATDAVGNVSTAASYTWTVDSTPPTAPVAGNITVNQNAPGTADSVQGSASAVEASSTVKIWADGLLTTLIVSGTAMGDGSFTALSIGDNAYATIYVTATDAAGNQSSATSKTNDISPPLLSISNVEGDSGSPFYDTVNDSNTDIAVSAGDAVTCKWDTTDVAYASMANTCASTSLCTITGAATDGSSYTRYVDCADAAGNTQGVSGNLNVTWMNDYTAPTISVSNVEGDTAATYYDNANDSNTDIAISVTDASGAVTCKWDTTDIAYGSMANTCTSTSLCTITGAATEGSTYAEYVACIDAAGNANDATNNLAVTWTNDYTAPPLTLTSVEGDTAATYYDTANDSNTDIVLTSTDAVSGTSACRWYATDSAYDAGTGTACASATACQFTGAATDGTAYTRSIACVDNAGNGNSTTNNLDVSWTNDFTAPATGTVNDGTGADVTYTTSATTMDANWTGFSDATSGVASYDYNISTTTGCAGDVVTSVNVAAATSKNSTGLSLTNGSTYYNCVRAKDAANNTSAFVASNGVVVDTTAPSAPTTVNDGTGADIAWQSSITAMDANWTASSDAVSGISNYEYCLSTSNVAGTCTGVDTGWVVLGNVTSVSRTGLTLTNFTNYYVHVRAKDNVGLYSGVTVSNGVQTDTVNPSTPATVNDGGGADLFSQVSTTTISANWTASTDSGSGVGSYDWSIGTAPAGTTVQAWTNVGNVTTASNSSLTLTNGTTYYVNVRAKDVGGNLSGEASSNGVKVDTSPPTFGGLTSATAVSTSQIDLAWSAGSDTVTASGNLVYDICRSTTSLACQGSFTATCTSGAGATSFSDTGTNCGGSALAAGTRYYYVVRAKDQAGNADGNTTEMTSVTWTATGAVQAITGGSQHTCALGLDARIRCWGYNGVGQLGDGTTANRTTPVLVSTLTSAVTVSGGGSVTCALTSSGGIMCWGYNGYGDLGDGTTTNKATPVAVSTLSDAVAVSSGDGHSCALASDGLAKCWGRNSNGQLGDGTTANRPTPAAVSTLTGAMSVNACGVHTCALANNGTVKCWGLNANGQLGDGSTTDRPTPVTVTSLTSAVALSAGSCTWHTCALVSDGTAKCWGRNDSGQVGDGSTTDRPTPTTVTSLTGAVALAAGGYHSCALLSDGTPKCWGFNSSGQLGDGTSVARSSPVAVSALTGIVSITAGNDHTCALTNDGTARCWGSNGGGGQLGDGTTTNKVTPVAVTNLVGPLGVKLPRLHESTASGAPARPFREGLSGGSWHTCAVVSDGTVRCWGYNTYGQLGEGTTSNKSTPVAVSTLSNAVAVAGGSEHTCSLLSDGTVKCWGYNFSGQLGDGTTVSKTTAVTVSSLSDAVTIAASEGHACALLGGGTVRCWGRNTYGALGDGTTIDKASPVAVSTLSGAVAVATGGSNGGSHSCALLSDGTVRCWGRNTYGALGDGTVVDKATPVTVSSLSSAVAVSNGDSHSCSLISDGTARCWGGNGNGQLGDGTTANKSTPVSVTALSNAVAVAAGDSHTCALLADGTGRCWGKNDNGRLGDGTTGDRTTPVVVSSFSSAVAITSGGGNGGGHTCSLLSDGTVKCWGQNTYGQLGDGTTVNRLTPVQVQNLP